MTRRHWLTVAAAAPFAAAQTRLPVKKALYWSMLPSSLSVVERFQLARDAGFDEIELPTAADPAVAGEMLEASNKTGLRIHSVMNQEHWRSPLSSADPAVVERSLEGMRASLQNARLWGADTVLLVPAVVDAQTSYAQAWERSRANIRKLIPLAAELNVVIAIEEVWNKFLLSPLEFARYIDEFDSPWVRAYFDVGNIALIGFPHDWIRTLGARIVKIHIKDFAFKTDPNLRKRVADFTPLLEGEIDWRAVHTALAEIGYRGTATLELPSGDAAYIREVSARLDRILNGL